MSEARQTLDRSISEREFQNQVVHAARLYGWRVMHARPAMRQSGGWSTPIQGDPGYPDLTLARDGRIVFAELKSMKGKLSEHQQAWLDELMFNNAAAEVWVWTPDMWDEIEQVLR